MQFTKPPKTFDEQVTLLLNRGMEINDRERAKHYLGHLNYYRLAAYWLPFEQDHSSHSFKPNITFDLVLDHYIFDRELRLLVMDAIERVEVHSAPAGHITWHMPMDHMLTCKKIYSRKSGNIEKMLLLLKKRQAVAPKFSSNTSKSMTKISPPYGQFAKS